MPAPLSWPTCLAMTTNITAWLAVAAVLSMGVIWAVYNLLKRNERLRQVGENAALARKTARPVFDELCDRHQLSEKEISLLRVLAQQIGLTLPALVFVEPQHLKSRSLQEDPDSALASAIGTKLFGADLMGV